MYEDNGKELSELVIQSANTALSQQGSNGQMPAGRNGPWDDPDTPVRNTSHWLITFSVVYNITEQEKFRKAAQSALTYLTSAEARPEGVAWHHRNSEKSKTNGLVGQAWTIEALHHAYVADIGGNNDVELKKVIAEHPFNSHLGSWEFIDLNGESNKTMFTLNQQIWFAAMVNRVATRLANSELQNQIEIFLDTLEEKITLTSEGAINHYLSIPSSPKAVISYLLANANQKRVPKPVLQLFRPDNTSTVHERSIGYHSFCLTGLALLAECNPTHSVWETEIIRGALKYANSENYFESVSQNPFGFQYNVPGFEVPYALDVFSELGKINFNRETGESWTKEQFKRHWDPELKTLSRNTVDPMTLSARIYEATRLLDRGQNYYIDSI